MGQSIGSHSKFDPRLVHHSPPQRLWYVARACERSRIGTFLQAHSMSDRTWVSEGSIVQDTTTWNMEELNQIVRIQARQIERLQLLVKQLNVKIEEYRIRLIQFPESPR